MHSTKADPNITNALTLVPAPRPVAEAESVAPNLSAELSFQQLSIVERHTTSVEVSASAGPLEQAATALTRASNPHVRNGKIARLPKPARDMLSQMLRNNLPYPKIVAALDELDITVTERNVSNWKTRGGYKDWCAEQERVLQFSLAQDKLTDYLRKNGAGELPEVGLQVAATQLSMALLQPEAAQQLAADPKKYSHIVDMLCRLSEQIEALQDKRNNRTSIYGKRNLLEEKFGYEEDVEITRKTYSSQ